MDKLPKLIITYINGNTEEFFPESWYFRPECECSPAQYVIHIKQGLRNHILADKVRRITVFSKVYQE